MEAARWAQPAPPITILAYQFSFSFCFLFRNPNHILPTTTCVEPSRRQTWISLDSFCWTARSSLLNFMQETLRDLQYLSFICQRQGEPDRNGRPSPGTQSRDAARCYVSISDNTSGWTGMVLCLRNTFHRRLRYSFASAPVYQVVHHPQSGSDRLFDITCKTYPANINEDIDLAVLSFVSDVESKSKADLQVF